MGVEWTSVPDVPVIVIVEVPVVAVPDAVKVSVEFTLLLAGGVTGLGANAAVTPLGRPEAVKVVAELKLFRLVMVTVLPPFPPCTIVTEEGEAPIVKSGDAAALTVNEIVVL